MHMPRPSNINMLNRSLFNVSESLIIPCNNAFEIISLRIVMMHVQSTLVVSTSVISNNRLSRRENLIPVLTQKSNIR